MKNISLLILGIIFSINSVNQCAAQSNSIEPINFKLEARASKQIYQLGEPVYLTLVLVNVTNRDVSFAWCFSVGAGEIQVFISEGKNNFKELNAGWGSVDAICPTTLKPNGRLEVNPKILWNFKPEESPNINPDVYERQKAVNIWSAFAFHNVGTHYLRARNGALESDPIQITITAPDGEDLEVWNKIQDSNDFAFLLQRDELYIQSYRIKEREVFQQKVETLINQYPNSFLAKSLETSLNKFKAKEAKRRKL